MAHAYYWMHHKKRNNLCNLERVWVRGTFPPPKMFAVSECTYPHLHPHDDHTCIPTESRFIVHNVHWTNLKHLKLFQHIDPASNCCKPTAATHANMFWFGYVICYSLAAFGAIFGYF